MNAADRALIDLLHWLKAQNYAFVTPTPLSHARHLARAGPAHEAKCLRDILGWNAPFRANTVAPECLAMLHAGDALVRRDDHFISRYRVASCMDLLFLHGAFPTVGHDSVFFGPDSYRYAAFVQRELALLPDFQSAVDVGAGAGVGALIVAAARPGIRLTLTDINPAALRLARINGAAAGTAFETTEAPDLDGVTGSLDLVLANPPYMSDPLGRQYRDGGGPHGAALSLRWADAATARLRPGGAMLLYTGSAIVAGDDALRAKLCGIAERRGCALRYDEIDPDVWGEELDTVAYAGVARIAAVSAVFTKARD